MVSLTYAKPEPVSLKNHPEFNEVWLQDRIQEDPSILGLGDITVIDRERRQEKAGRLDLLLSDPEDNRRYEVEVMLGSTDESHIIRAIEYWDIERRRYPAYDHTAVLIAENVTARFLNILSLFAGTIPLIIIQLNALKVGDQLVLDFVKVIDQTSLRRDDESESDLITTDRNYWTNRASVEGVELTEKLLKIINEKAATEQQLNYNKRHIGLTDGIRARNFVYFSPRKKFVHIWANINDNVQWIEQLEDAGLTCAISRGRVRVTIAPKDLNNHGGMLTEFLHEAVELFEA